MGAGAAGSQPGLAHQSLKRPLTEDEQNLARALEKAFAAGEHDFSAVVGKLQEEGVKRPSGQPGEWTVAVLEAELAAINASLDAAYVKA
jgi:hypothetical protein